MSAHFWGDPDSDGVRACIRKGCTVRIADSFRRWQPKPSAKWRMQMVELIPDCAGGGLPVKEKP